MPKRVLFVCLGNICRSPTAEGVARHYILQRELAGAIEVDSAGTQGYHTGEPPDARAIAAARRRGIDIGELRARRVAAEDFAGFDLILAMDQDNLYHLQRLCPPEHRTKLGLFMHYSQRYEEDEVPDPYFGGDAGFERVLDMAEDAVRGLLEELAADQGFRTPRK